MKFGIGLGIGYIKYSAKLNLCSSYQLTIKGEYDSMEVSNHFIGECIGKTKIDEINIENFIPSAGGNFVVYERVTQNSIWKIISVDATIINYSDFQLENFDHKIRVDTSITSFDMISYTYRF